MHPVGCADSSPSTSKPADGDIDVKSLSQERIKQLMKADPKFIQRIIGVSA